MKDHLCYAGMIEKQGSSKCCAGKSEKQKEPCQKSEKPSQKPGKPSQKSGKPKAPSQQPMVCESVEGMKWCN